MGVRSRVRRALYIIAGIENHVYKHRTADVASTRGHAWLNNDWPRYSSFSRWILHPWNLYNEYQADILEQFEISKMAAGANRKTTFEPVDIELSVIPLFYVNLL